jgi:hypothetical protein
MLYSKQSFPNGSQFTPGEILTEMILKYRIEHKIEKSKNVAIAGGIKMTYF